MEKWYKSHQGLIFFILTSASIVTYALTTFSTKSELSEFRASSKAELSELKTDIKDDIKEIKQDVKVLLQRGKR